MRRVNRGIVATVRRGYARTVGERAVAVELAAAVGALVLVQAYANLLDLVTGPVRDAARPVAFLHRSVAASVVYETLLFAGVVALVVAYAGYRGFDVSLSLPAREDAPLVAGATLGAATLALVIAGYATAVAEPSVGALTSALLAGGALSEGLSWALSWRLGLELLVTVPATALLFHGFVQNAFRRVVDRTVALALTVAVVGFALVGSAGIGVGRSTVSYRLSPGGVVVAALLVAAVGAAAYANDRSVPDWLRSAATALPLLVAFGIAAVAVATSLDVVVGSWDAADLVFGLARFAALGVAAYAYDRTDSLLAPVLTYASFALAYALVSWVHLHALLAAG